MTYSQNLDLEKGNATGFTHPHNSTTALTKLTDKLPDQTTAKLTGKLAGKLPDQTTAKLTTLNDKPTDSENETTAKLTALNDKPTDSENETSAVLTALNDKPTDSENETPAVLTALNDKPTDSENETPAKLTTLNAAAELTGPNYNITAELTNLNDKTTTTTTAIATLPDSLVDAALTTSTVTLTLTATDVLLQKAMDGRVNLSCTFSFGGERTPPSVSTFKIFVSLVWDYVATARPVHLNVLFGILGCSLSLFGVYLYPGGIGWIHKKLFG